MKRVLIVIGLALADACSASQLLHGPAVAVVQGGGGGVPAPVQSNHKDAGSVASTTIAYSGNTAAGGLGICVVRLGSASATVSTLTDSQGKTWTRAGSPVVQATDGHTLEVWYAPNLNAAADTLTITPSTTTTLRIHVLEYSGCATASPLDKTASTTGTGTAIDSTATATTAQTNELIFGAASGSGGSAWTAGNDGNGHTMVARQSTATEKLLSEDVTVSSTEAAKATATSASTENWVGIVCTFKGS